MPESIAICWLRRDLRYQDQAALYHALQGGLPVLPLFIFDRAILDKLEDRDDARVTFIHGEVSDLHAHFGRQGGTLLVRYGHVSDVWKELLDTYNVRAVYTNRDYEPYAKTRDESVNQLLAARDIPFYRYKDQVIFESDEILTGSGGVYKVFTPYSRAWRQVLRPDAHLRPFRSEDHLDKLLNHDPAPVPSLDAMGFATSNLDIPGRQVRSAVLKAYGQQRDLPAADATSRLGVHLRFGTLSIRALVSRALQESDVFLNELIWREFYSAILDQHPHVVDSAFKPQYDQIDWRQSEADFQRWCEGRTGYPIVDAGMRQLNQTGYMHNRVRMITASFLTKHLLLDWRWGEAYFARKLLDYELSNNNGGWQWAAGTGTDAQPYFRIFNPYSQTDKFDADRAYIRQWVPEYDTDDYPEPMVPHKEARERALATYKAALDRS